MTERITFLLFHFFHPADECQNLNSQLGNKIRLKGFITKGILGVGL